MLHICNFSKSYGNLTVLNIRDLTLKPGIYWIKGANGSGKTSLFKSIAGIVPFQGQISMNGLDQKKNPVAYRMAISYSDAEPLYPGFLTASDLIGFVGTARKASRQQQAALADSFGVASFLHRPCSTYSSGMLKKVSLVLTFLGSSPIIILDEPFIAIDDVTRDVLHHKIREMQQQGVTFLLSSHEPVSLHSVSVDKTFMIHNKTLLPE